MIFRKSAGIVLIACGTGLAAISGVLAYAGFESQIKIPFAGWIGPFTAAACIALGIAVETELRHFISRLMRQDWGQAAGRGVITLILAGLLVTAALLDRHSGELALANKVETAHQAVTDRQTAFDTATGSKAAAEKLIADLEAELLVMTGDDIKKAQTRLSALGLYLDEAGKPMPIDGARGPRTLQAMADRGKEIRGLLVTAREELKKATDTVAAGAPTAELPFNLSDAGLYATLITVLSIVLAFAGSYVFAGFDHEKTVDDELEELEDVVSGVEGEIFELVSFMDEQKKRPRKRASR